MCEIVVYTFVYIDAHAHSYEVYNTIVKPELAQGQLLYDYIETNQILQVLQSQFRASQGTHCVCKKLAKTRLC